MGVDGGGKKKRKKEKKKKKKEKKLAMQRGKSRRVHTRTVFCMYKYKRRKRGKRGEEKGRRRRIEAYAVLSCPVRGSLPLSLSTIPYHRGVASSWSSSSSSSSSCCVYFCASVTIRSLPQRAMACASHRNPTQPHVLSCNNKT